MNDTERRNMWADRIERCLASDMTIREWCRLNHVGQSCLYKWMARFREEEPGRFPSRSSVASNWVKVTRAGIADSRAIVPAGTADCAVPLAADGSGAASPIRALVGRVELAIPPGSAQADIESAMRAAVAL